MQVAVKAAAAAVSAELPPAFTALGQARELVHAALSGWDVGAISDDVALVASELVANALIHGLRLPADGCARPGAPRPGRVELKLVSTGSHLICTVKDPNPAPPVRRSADDTSMGGRGLQLIEALSLCWGWTPSGGTKSVWAIFPLAPAQARRRAEPAVSLRAS